MRFTINLATKIYVNTRLLNVILATVFLLLSSMLAIGIRYVAGNAAQMTRLTRETAVLDGAAKPASKGVPEKDYHALLDRIGFANTVIEKKMYNWVDLLDRLEQVVPDGVAISSINPDPKNHGLKLSGVARSFNHVRLFLERLEDSSFFSDVYLASQGEAKQGNAMPTSEFSITCKVNNK